MSAMRARLAGATISPREVFAMFKPRAESNPLAHPVTRRSLLQVGALALGGLSLADVLRIRASGGQAGDHENASVIFVELAGGPSHFETYDPKPEAPAEYRGPLATIPTSIS